MMFNIIDIAINKLADSKLVHFRSFFFRKKGHIVDTLSVRPSVRPSVCLSVRPSVRPSVCLSVPEIENDSRYLRDNIAVILYCNILISSYQYHKSSNYVLLDELLIADS